MGPRDLYDLCAELLAAAAEALTLTAAGTIDYRFVSPGLPALDCCPMLSVHAGVALEGDTSPLGPPLQPGSRSWQTAKVPLIGMTITVVRCAPVLHPDRAGESAPSAAVLNGISQTTLDDVWAIWNYLTAAHRDGAIFAGPSRPREMFLEAATPLPTSGGCAGWEIPVRVELSGFSRDIEVGS